MDKNIEIRKCLYSGEEFLPKRNNQVFASKKNRINYHNAINNKLRNELKSINNQLIINYKICKELLGIDKTRLVHKEFLRGKGFDFSFFTNIAENSKKTAYVHAVYEFGFEKTDDNNYLIFKI